VIVPNSSASQIHNQTLLQQNRKLQVKKCHKQKLPKVEKIAQSSKIAQTFPIYPKAAKTAQSCQKESNVTKIAQIYQK
jgi:hypothetical protein